MFLCPYKGFTKQYLITVLKMFCSCSNYFSCVRSFECILKKLATFVLVYEVVIRFHILSF